MSATQLTVSQWIRSLARAPDPDPPLTQTPLNAEDLARVLTGFRGQPMGSTPPMRYDRRPDDGNSSVYVLDDDSAMVYILD